MDVDTRGSSFNTVVGVYTGATLGTLVSTASNNDRGTSEQARVWFPAVAGVAYQIAVDSADGVEGEFALKIRPVDSPVVTNLAPMAASAVKVAWSSVEGERYFVGVSTNLQQWSMVTSLVASAAATVVDVNPPSAPTCFSRVERYLEP